MNVYEVVTARIVAELEKGVAPWVKPWIGGGTALLPYNARTRRQYNGVNVLLLWGSAFEKGYCHPAWLTFLQAKELGANVRKGEHAEHIVFSSSYTKKDADEEDGDGKEVRFLKFHNVFNVEQIDGLPQDISFAPEPRPLDELLNDANTFVVSLGADVRHGGGHAGDAPSKDCIVLPARERFESDAHYLATSIHEHAHWSGHPSRLDRDLAGRFGDAQYAAEELIAELTAAYLCAHLAIPGALRHPEYIGNWLKVLGDDKRAIFTAAAKATEAANYLRNLSAPPAT